MDEPTNLFQSQTIEENIFWKHFTSLVSNDDEKHSIHNSKKGPMNGKQRLFPFFLQQRDNYIHLKRSSMSYASFLAFLDISYYYFFKLLPSSIYQDTKSIQLKMKDFWSFQQMKMRKASFRVLTFSLIFNLLAVVSLALSSSKFSYTIWGKDTILSHQVIGSYLIWLVYNIIFLGYFLIILYFPKSWAFFSSPSASPTPIPTPASPSASGVRSSSSASQRQRSDSASLYALFDPKELWQTLIHILIVGRFFIIIRHLCNMIFFPENSICYGFTDFSNPSSSSSSSSSSSPYSSSVSSSDQIHILMNSVFVQTIHDVFQSFVFTILPWKWSNLLSFAFLQYFEIVFRILSCSNYVQDFPLRKEIIGSIVTAVTTFFLSVVVLSSLAFYNSLKYTYLNLLKHRKAAEDNMNFVNLLCDDVKVSTLKHCKSLNSLEIILKKEIYETFFQSDVISLFALSECMNSIVDDLIFLIKVEEKRFTFSCIDDISIPNVFSFILRVFCSEYCNVIKYPRIEEIIKSKFVIEISSNLPMVHSDRNCLRILLLYSIILTVELLKKDGEPLNGLISLPHITVTCELTDGPTADIRFAFTWKEPLLAEKRVITGEINSTIDSAFVMCRKITDTFDGYYILTPKSLEFNIPYSHYNSDIPRLSLLSNKTNAEMVLLQEFLTHHACVILSDTRFESLILDNILAQLPGGKEIAVERDYQNMHILPFSVIFIQSEAALLRLQTLGYKGKVVLLSERLAYFGDLKKSGIAFGLALPITEDGFKELRRFLYKIARDYAALKNVSMKYNSRAAALVDDDIPIELLSEKKSELLPLNLDGEEVQTQERKINAKTVPPSRWTRILQNFPYFHRFQLRQDRIDNVSESYYKWRYLNPTGTFISRGIVLDLMVFVQFIYALSLFYLRAYGIPILVVMALSVCLMACRSICYRWLQHRNIPFSSVYKVFIFILLFGSTITIFFDFYRLALDENRRPRIINMRTIHYDSFNEYISSRYGLITGLYTVSYFLNIPVFFRYGTEAIPRPYTTVLIVLITIRFIFNLITYDKSNLLPRIMIFIAMIGFILYSIAFLISHYFQMNITETEFLLVYDRILSKDLFERCSYFTRYLLIPRLKQFDEIEELLLEKIQSFSTELQSQQFFHSSLSKLQNQDTENSLFPNVKNLPYSECFILSPDFIEILHQIRHFKRMSNSLIFTLSTIETSHHISKFYTTPKHDLLIHFKAHMIRILVEDLLQTFVHGDYTIPLKYYVFIHPSVAMIRIYKELFLTVLSDMIQLAIQRIEKSTDDLPDDLGKIDHQLLIWIQPTTVTDRIIPFSEVRQLQITILDTGMMKLSRKRQDTDDEKAANMKEKGEDEEDEDDYEDKEEKSKNELRKFYNFRIEKNTHGSSILFNEIAPSSGKPKKGNLDADLPNDENGKPVFTNGRNPLLFNPKRGEIIQKEYHQLSDQFLSYFNQMNRSETGILYHPQYKSYQKTAIPILLCTKSHEMEKIIKQHFSPIPQVSSTPSPLLNGSSASLAGSFHISKIEPQTMKFYYQYCVEMQQLILNELSNVMAIANSIVLPISVEAEKEQTASNSDEKSTVAENTTIAVPSKSNEGKKGETNTATTDNGTTTATVTTVRKFSKPRKISKDEIKKKNIIELFLTIVNDYKTHLTLLEKHFHKMYDYSFPLLSSLILKLSNDPTMSKILVNTLKQRQQQSQKYKSNHLDLRAYHQQLNGNKREKSAMNLSSPNDSASASSSNSSNGSASNPLPVSGSGSIFHNTSKINNPNRKGILSLFCVSGEESSSKTNIISYLLKSRYWLCQTYCLEGFPAKKTFMNSDIVVLEYSPKLVKYQDRSSLYDDHSDGSSSNDSSDPDSVKMPYASSSYYYRQEMPYNIHDVIHFIRSFGFLGPIVIMYQNPKKLRELLSRLEYPLEKNDGYDSDMGSTAHGGDHHEGHGGNGGCGDYFLQSLRSPNEYSDAAKADLHLTLPWNEDIVDQILVYWKKQLINQLFMKDYPVGVSIQHA
jgi:hypothetical protein